jgi:hypothetical protein
MNVSDIFMQGFMLNDPSEVECLKQKRNNNDNRPQRGHMFIAT